jgi:L,D-transpeptidase YcbB
MRCSLLHRVRRNTAVMALAAAGMGTACESADMKALRKAAVGNLLSTVSRDSIVHLAGGDTLHMSAATMAFYQGRSGQSAWVGRTDLLSEGHALREAVGRAWEDGLPPERYRHDVATAILAGIQEEGGAPLSDSLLTVHLAEVDVLLTEGFNRLARDLAVGMLDPVAAGLDHRIPGNDSPDETILNRVVEGVEPGELVNQLRPSMPQYQRMRTALAAYHEAELGGEWPQVRADTTLQRGHRSEAVGLLRTRLTKGVDAREAELAMAGASDPMLFDADLERAVQRFQGRHAIEADGVVGAATLKELNHTITEWIAELRFNLDRWRWLPNSLGNRYVLVNIAGFEMEVVDEGRIIEAMNVVVGQRDLATPLFADSIRHVVVNPYWNVPDGIMERTIRPALEEDPDYLAKNDMEYFNGRVRQRPGPQNSLGRFKFIFPNEFDVYLHDTPDDHLFSRTERAFSSGCVRLERPHDFARLLLELQSSQNADSLDALLATGRETWLELDRPLPVFLLYFTAWAQEDGTVRFHHDVYGRTEAMEGQAEAMVSTVVPVT